MTDTLEDVAARYRAASDEVASLKERLPVAQQLVRDLRPILAAAIVEGIRTGQHTQIEVSRLTGYTPERIRQLCREAGLEPERVATPGAR